jgi:hypothetical protein
VRGGKLFARARVVSAIPDVVNHEHLGILAHLKTMQRLIEDMRPVNVNQIKRRLMR